jgi:hypothetical protein
MSLGTALAGFLYQGQFRPVALIMFLFMVIAIPLIAIFMKKDRSEQSLCSDKALPVMH